MCDSPTTIRQGFAFLIHDISKLLNRHYDQRIRIHGISRTQWTLLTYLSRQEGISQTKLAEYMSLAPMTLTRQIDQLEEKKLLERRNDPQDRRTNLIFLSIKSQDLMEKMHRAAVEIKEKALEGLNESEKELLKESLMRIRNNLLDTDED